MNSQAPPVVIVTTDAYRGVWRHTYDCPFCSTARHVVRHVHGGGYTHDPPFYGLRESHCPRRGFYELKPVNEGNEHG
jgi:hypothetical protein